MNIKKLPVLPILAFVAIVAAGYGIYKNVEFQEIEYFEFPSSEVRSNKLLAAARLLDRSHNIDHEVAEDRHVFSNLDSSKTGILWLRDVTELEDQREAENIIAWIKAGGILLTSPAGNIVFDDSTIPGWFMNELGISERTDDDDSRANEFNGDMDIVPVILPDQSIDTPLLHIFSNYEPYFKLTALDDEQSTTLIDGDYLIHRSLGKGYYTVYADEDLFDNEEIDSHDQAYLLLWLTQPTQYKTLSIVHEPDDKPGLFSVTWNKFTIAICVLGIALVGFLRWASSRLGPVEQELAPIKNNLIAHLEARGAFWYRRKYSNKAIAQVQQAAIDKLSPHGRNASKDAGLSDAERSSIIKLASEQLECDPKLSEQILFGEATGDAAILRTSKALQQLLHLKPLQPNR